MMTWNVPLRVVSYVQEGEWVAHCLEFDVLGSGLTRRESVESLAEAIRIQVDESLRHGNARNLFSPADGEILERFAAGHDVDAGEVELDAESLSRGRVRIESVTVREYVLDQVGDELVSA